MTNTLKKLRDEFDKEWTGEIWLARPEDKTEDRVQLWDFVRSVYLKAYSEGKKVGKKEAVNLSLEEEIESQ